MARLHYNGLTAKLGAALSGNGTTITFQGQLTAAGAQVGYINSPDYLPLTILTSTGDVSEIVYLTSYAQGSTTGTIQRGMELTPSGTTHATGDLVIHAPTANDFAPIPTSTSPPVMLGPVSATFQTDRFTSPWHSATLGATPLTFNYHDFYAIPLYLIQGSYFAGFGANFLSVTKPGGTFTPNFNLWRDSGNYSPIGSSGSIAGSGAGDTSAGLCERDYNVQIPATGVYWLSIWWDGTSTTGSATMPMALPTNAFMGLSGGGTGPAYASWYGTTASYGTVPANLARSTNAPRLLWHQ